MRAAERGDIFGTPDGEVVRVERVSRVSVTVQVIGGARDGERQRLVPGIPDNWARYPR